jgi:hypothetical protein
MDWEAHFADPNNFQPYRRMHALSMRVLVVATSRVEGAWCAYCDAVPGMTHSNEYQDVLDHGDKLGEEVARAMFPEFEGVPYSG